MMTSSPFLRVSDDNIELSILCKHQIDPKCKDDQTMNSKQWLKKLHIGEMYACKTFFVCFLKKN